MIDLSQLKPESILGNLPFYDFCVDLSTPGHVIAERFEREPELPGVILSDGSHMVGIISRQKFLERMCHRYSLEIHLRRPVKLMLDFIKVQPLLLPDTCKIDEATERALNRSPEAAYEPIVIVFKDKSLRLLDFHVLLRAQSHILAMVNQMVEQQKFAVQEYVQKLRQEQKKAEQYNQLLEMQQSTIQEHNKLLEEKQDELLRQSQEIHQLNQRFIRIGQLLSLEGKKAFQATFEGVDAISNNTDNMIEMGRALNRELETVQGASVLIKKVSKQAEFLAKQASVLGYQFGSQFEWLSRVTSDIRQLSSQAFEAGQRMDETSNRLKYRIGELTQLAREGANVAQTLIQKVSRAEVALAELEKLVQEDAKAVEPDHDTDLVAVESLMQKVEQTGVALSELEEFSRRGDVSSLISKIERKLKYGGRKVLN